MEVQAGLLELRGLSMEIKSIEPGMKLRRFGPPVPESSVTLVYENLALMRLLVLVPKTATLRRFPPAAAP